MIKKWWSNLIICSNQQSIQEDNHPSSIQINKKLNSTIKKSLRSTQFRNKSSCVKINPNPLSACKSSQLELSTSTHLLSPANQIYKGSSKITVLKLIEEIREIIEDIYEKDVIQYEKYVIQMITKKQKDQNLDLQNRLNYLLYLENGGQYKYMSEVDHQIQKQWRKHPILCQMLDIWCRQILKYRIQNCNIFIAEYRKIRRVIADVSSFYFKNILINLEIKGIKTNTYIFQDTAHKIIQNHSLWDDIYHSKLIAFVKLGNQNHQLHQMISKFDIGILNINPEYLDLSEFGEKNNLKETIEIISMLSKQTKIHKQIILLKLMRKYFLKEIEANSNKICESQNIVNRSILEKDDVIDCMIYCIVKGKIGQLSDTLDAMSLLLQHSSLLVKKGVDSFRADLECAIEYIRFAESLKQTKNDGSQQTEKNQESRQ